MVSIAAPGLYRAAERRGKELGVNICHLAAEAASCDKFPLLETDSHAGKVRGEIIDARPLGQTHIESAPHKLLLDGRRAGDKEPSPLKAIPLNRWGHKQPAAPENCPSKHALTGNSQGSYALKTAPLQRR
jgi:hypothetical protein